MVKSDKVLNKTKNLEVAYEVRDTYLSLFPSGERERFNTIFNEVKNNPPTKSKEGLGDPELVRKEGEPEVPKEELIGFKKVLRDSPQCTKTFTFVENGIKQFAGMEKHTIRSALLETFYRFSAEHFLVDESGLRELEAKGKKLGIPADQYPPELSSKIANAAYKMELSAAPRMQFSRAIDFKTDYVGQKIENTVAQDTLGASKMLMNGVQKEVDRSKILTGEEKHQFFKEEVKPLNDKMDQTLSMKARTNTARRDRLAKHSASVSTDKSPDVSGAEVADKGYKR